MIGLARHRAVTVMPKPPGVFGTDSAPNVVVCSEVWRSEVHTSFLDVTTAARTGGDVLSGLVELRGRPEVLPVVPSDMCGVCDNSAVAARVPWMAVSLTFVAKCCTFVC
jgi:hypothetical protein